MKSKYLKISLIILFFIFQFQKSFSSDVKKVNIIAKIDNKIITNVDVEIESRYLQSLNPDIKNLDQRKKFLLAKNSLIKEKIKENELINYVNISKQKDALFEDTMRGFYKKLGLKNEADFNEYLVNSDLSLKDVEYKILIETSWNSLI